MSSRPSAKTISDSLPPPQGETPKYTFGVGGWGWDQNTHSKGLRPLPPPPNTKIAIEFKFTVKLKLEFDFDFDLISGSNFNKMGVKVVQISIYHFQI